MARKKQQKKRLKKYQGKYVTANRVDMSKGGRVGYQKGNAVVRDGLATTEQETKKKKPTKNVKPVIEQKPLQSISGTSIGSGNQTTMTRQELDKLEGNTDSVGDNQIDKARSPTLDVKPAVQPQTKLSQEAIDKLSGLTLSLIHI